MEPLVPRRERHRGRDSGCLPQGAHRRQRHSPLRPVAAERRGAEQGPHDPAHRADGQPGVLGVLPPVRPGASHADAHARLRWSAPPGVVRHDALDRPTERLRRRVCRVGRRCRRPAPASIAPAGSSGCRRPMRGRSERLSSTPSPARPTWSTATVASPPPVPSARFACGTRAAYRLINDELRPWREDDGSRGADQSAGAPSLFDVHPLEGTGQTGTFIAFVVVLAETAPATAELETRVTAAALRWHLSPTETRIPPPARSFPDVASVLLALDEIYHLNHRGPVGRYQTTKQEDGRIRLVCETPYPAEFRARSRRGHHPQREPRPRPPLRGRLPGSRRRRQAHLHAGRLRRFENSRSARSSQGAWRETLRRTVRGRPSSRSRRTCRP